MAKFSLKKYGYLDSVNKVHRLIDELKTRKVRLTSELKTRIVGKIQSKEALLCWRNRFSELEWPETEKENFPHVISAITTNKQIITTGKNKRRKRKKGTPTDNSIILDPNRANYSTDLLKAGLKEKFKDYSYDLSDW